MLYRNYSCFDVFYVRFTVNMIDLLELAIPFKTDFVSILEQGDRTMSFFNGDIHDFGFKNIGGRGLYKTDDGILKTDMEYHAYEQLPTSHTGIAMKFFPESMHDFPHIRLKCSPAKVFQGHNLFGSLDIGSAVREMVGFLYTAYPDIHQYVDELKTEVRHIDVTFSARLKSEQDVQQVIKFLKNVSSGQRKARFSGYDGTCYWGAADSRLLRLKAYNKQDEYRAQLEQFQKKAKTDPHALFMVNLMSDQRLIEWSKGLFRFEAGFMARWIERRGYSVNVVDLVNLQRSFQSQGRCILTEWWQEATREIYAACEGQTVRTNDHDYVLNKIRFVHQRITCTGKISYSRATRLYEFYRAIERDGIDDVRARYSDNVYFTNMRDLEPCGFSKGYMQNLHQNYESGSGVIPILKMIEVDFQSQIPEWYVPPKSSFSLVA
jgi:II/X family phage/plasmid replication protein